jgi:hypothetical protein
VLKNILAYCGYSPTSPFFFWLSEHKHCDNAATNSNSENARSRMVASLRGSVGTGTKEDESSNGRIWAAWLHCVTARSRLARVFELMNRLFFNFPNFFSGHGQPRIQWSTCIWQQISQIYAMTWLHIAGWHVIALYLLFVSYTWWWIGSIWNT